MYSSTHRYIICVISVVVGLSVAQQGQRLPPGVNPQVYNQPPPGQFQPPPPPQQMGGQFVQGAQGQFQQPQQGQIQQPQQGQFQQPQQGQFQQPHLEVPHAAQQHGGHAGGFQGQNILDAQHAIQDREHLKEHISVPMDTSKMTEQELQFHYFKMHDADNNNRLDGSELVKSLIHWHDQSNHDPKAGGHIPEPKIFTDDELLQMIDPILEQDDKNKDGFIDYPEFVAAQAAAASRE